MSNTNHSKNGTDYSYNDRRSDKNRNSQPRNRSDDYYYNYERDNRNDQYDDRSDKSSSRDPPENNSGHNQNQRRSPVDEDKARSSQANYKRPRYNTTIPPEIHDRPSGSYKVTNSKFAICDSAILSIKETKKKNEIRFGPLVRSKLWPHGRLVSYMVNLYAKKLQEKFFDMLINHVIGEKRGPISPLDSIQVPKQLPGQQVDLQKLLNQAALQF